MSKEKKVVLVGCGNVGMSYAYSLVNHNYGISELVMIDIDKEKLIGKVLDLNHCIANSDNNMKIIAGDYADCKDADIVCITAGPSQMDIKSSRLDDLYKADNMFKSIVPEIKASGFDGIYLIASNPLDVITYMTWKYSGIDYKKVIGSGTLLDTARLKFVLSEKYNKNIKDVEGYVLGEHGDTQFVAWSGVNVKVKDNEKEEIAESVKKAGFEVLKHQGFTCYGIGYSLSRITEAILLDEHATLPVSTYIPDLNIFISTPSVIGKDGVLENTKMKLTTDETKAFMDSAYSIKSSIQALQTKANN